MSIREKLIAITKPYAPHYKIVNVSELADFIFEMEIGDEVYFAETWDTEIDPDKLDGSCCEGWYGIKIIQAFDRTMAIFNWSGGGKAFAAEVDEDTLEYSICYYLRHFVEGTTVFHKVVLEY